MTKVSKREFKISADKKFADGLLMTCFSRRMIDFRLRPGNKKEDFLDRKIQGDDGVNPFATRDFLENISYVFNAALCLEKCGLEEAKRICNSIVVFLEQWGYGNYHFLMNFGVNTEGDRCRRSACYSMLEAVFMLRHSYSIDAVGREQIICEHMKQISKKAADDLRHTEGLGRKCGSCFNGGFNQVQLSGLSNTAAPSRLNVDHADFLWLFDSGLSVDWNRGFVTEEEETKAWQVICNKFVRGMNVDSIIQSGFMNGCFYNKDPEKAAFMHYYLARILLKRGDVYGGLTALHMAQNECIESGSISAKRLLAPIDARLKLNKHFDVACMLDEFELQLDQIFSNPNVSEEYKAYEAASLCGAIVRRSITDFCLEGDAKIPHLQRIIEKHSSIIAMFSSVENSQRVDSMSLKLCYELACLRGKVGVGSSGLIRELALDGFNLSHEVQNSLFHIQSVMMLALTALLERDLSLYVVLKEVIAWLKAEYGVCEKQEGFSFLDLHLAKAESKILKGRNQNIFNSSKPDVRALGLIEKYKQARGCLEGAFRVDIANLI